MRSSSFPRTDDSSTSSAATATARTVSRATLNRGGSSRAVYVSDIKGVQVFDGDGRYLTAFKPSPIAFGMGLHDQKELLVAARTQVFKLVLNEP